MKRHWLLLAIPTVLLAQPPEAPRERDIRFRPQERQPAVSQPLSSQPPVAAEGEVRIPRSYALIVGIGAYPGLPEDVRLRYAERDAEAIYSILISPEGGNFRAENVHRLIGPKATRANLQDQLEHWLPSSAGPDDRVLIYYAGHSFFRDGKVYLVPWDIDLERIAETGYPMERLGETFGSRVQGKYKILLADSCHSGAVNPVEDAEVIRRRLIELDRSVFILTASRDRERSFESAEWGGGHGIFTYYVVRGMEGHADESGDGIVTADELAEYVRRNVREATGGQQNPTSDKGSFDPEMMLAYLPSGARPGAPPPPKFGTLIIEANMDGVEVFVNGQSVGVVNRGKPIRLPGLAPGAVTVKGVRMGFEPDGPREEMIYPGQDSTVSIRIQIPRKRPKAALEKFDQGVDRYRDGTQAAYRKAAALFEEALRLDSKFSQAALYAGRAYDALYEQERAAKFYQRAIAIDPDYLEARASYGGMLLGMGSLDEAIRQFNAVTRRDPDHALALYLQAQAYRMKGLYDESVESARRSIAVNPNQAEAHFWLAESLRMKKQAAESSAEYETYLRMSDFDNGMAGKLNYYVVGYLAGLGRKKRASQRDIWEELRSLSYVGLCENAKNLKQFGTAIRHCQRALRYDPTDPFAHYLLGLSYSYEAESTGSLELLAAARRSFRTMLEINPNLKEAAFARENLEEIDRALREP